MAVSFSDLSSAAGLKKLDEYLLTRSYISGLVFAQALAFQFEIISDLLIANTTLLLFFYFEHSNTVIWL